MELGEVLEFMRLLWGVDHALNSTSKRMETTLGITGPQRLALRIIGRSPGIAAGVLADILHVHPSTLTGVLQRLEARGAIERQTDPSDRRRATFMLTTRGRELNDARSGTVEAAVRRALNDCADDDVAATRRMLSTLTRELTPPQADARAGTPGKAAGRTRSSAKRRS
jgi:DNA-binding MarR family transcriptional regulator